MNPVSHSLLACISLGAFLSSQGIHCVPSSLSANEGRSGALLADGRGPQRRQIVIDAGELSALVGHDLTALVFRRDGNVSPDALTPGTLHASVSIGIAAFGPDEVRPDLAANLPAPQLVFSGSVPLPASPDARARQPQWSGSDVVEIPFAAPWRYSGGDLAIELQYSGSGTIWWPIDAHEDPATGSVQSFGHACGGRAAVWGTTNHAADVQLVVGGTASFQFNGAANAFAWFFVGITPLSSPMDLGFVGAAGCTFDIAPILSLATAVSADWTPDPAVGGMAELALTMPSSPLFLGAEIWTQWLEIDDGAITTSNALRCRIGSTPPAALVTTLTQVGSAPPRVQPGAAPVVGLRWQ
ncbi:MAG: hypothetical protein IT457_15375 [Planctomycetes bacterium]|nr:hypothetical protein [Planctomycetota bacterium]